MIKTLINLTTIAILSSSLLHASDRSPFKLSSTHFLRGSDDGSGSVTVDRFDARGGLPLYIKDKTLIALGFRYALDRYNFNNTEANWGAINRTDVGLAYRWAINDRWLWSNYSIAASAVEEGASSAGSFLFNHITIAKYTVNDRLTLAPGFIASNDINKGIDIFPLVIVDWEFNDELKLGSGPSDVSSSGANAYLTYTPKSLNSKWIFTAGLEYSSRNFVLADIEDGSGEDRRAAAYVAASYKLDNGLKFSAVAGYNFYQNIRTLDSQGNDLSEENLDDAPYIGISLALSF